MNKVALITGITGQDGSYLSELLLGMGYDVHGVIRRKSTIGNLERIGHLFKEDDPRLHYGDLGDGITELIYELKPDEIYNLASQSQVRLSFDVPVYTGNVGGLGAVRILEDIRKISPHTKFYQASTSEIIGNGTLESPKPVSPYGCTKLYAYWMTKIYREAYGLFTCNGILYNHESERRGISFVTQKIVHAAVNIKLGLQDKIELGDIETKRDWGYAKDFVRAIYMMMQHDKPEDYEVCTGKSHSVKDFLERVFSYLGLNYLDYLVINDYYKRPCEVNDLKGNPQKIQEELGWKPEVDFDKLIKIMVEARLKLVDALK